MNTDWYLFHCLCYDLLVMVGQQLMCICQIDVTRGLAQCGCSEYVRLADYQLDPQGDLSPPPVR